MSIQIDTFLVDKSLFKRTIFGISKKVRFGEFLKIWSLRLNSVTRQVNFINTRIVEIAKIQKFKWDILSNFQTMWVGNIFDR